MDIRPTTPKDLKHSLQVVNRKTFNKESKERERETPQKLFPAKKKKKKSSASTKTSFFFLQSITVTNRCTEFSIIFSQETISNLKKQLRQYRNCLVTKLY
ncbi:hypothetical protein CHUAL_013170 [Chamberlinius hualienensis]